MTRRAPHDWPDEVEIFEIDENGQLSPLLARLVRIQKDHPIVAVYQAEAWISPNSERIMTYVVRIKVDGQAYPSGMTRVIVTRFPVVEPESAMPVFVTDPQSQERFVANELVVDFKPGTSPTRIQEIVAYEGAEVLARVGLSNDVFKLQIRGAMDLSSLHQTAKAFESYPDVEQIQLQSANTVLP